MWVLREWRAWKGEDGGRFPDLGGSDGTRDCGIGDWGLGIVDWGVRMEDKRFGDKGEVREQLVNIATGGL